MNVCVIARDTMYMIRIVVGIFVKGVVISVVAIKLICNPGMRPVMVPDNIPKMRVIMFSIINENGVRCIFGL